MPVVVLSAKGLEQDKIMQAWTSAPTTTWSSPSGCKELLARIRAVLRRRYRDEEIGPTFERHRGRPALAKTVDSGRPSRSS
jgi:DNA-binding response OmpR family regulator